LEKKKKCHFIKEGLPTEGLGEKEANTGKISKRNGRVFVVGLGKLTRILKKCNLMGERGEAKRTEEKGGARYGVKKKNQRRVKRIGATNTKESERQVKGRG